MAAKPTWTPRGARPPRYAGWMNELLGGPIPRETAATCGSCTMCAGADDRPEDRPFFAPDVKCCSYVPVLPNFLVARSLRDPAPELAEGRKMLEARIAPAST